jgi:hypothetical protein
VQQSVRQQWQYATVTVCDCDRDRDRDGDSVQLIFYPRLSGVKSQVPLLYSTVMPYHTVTYCDIPYHTIPYCDIP